jgi:hypothetical protein
LLKQEHDFALQKPLQLHLVRTVTPGILLASMAAFSEIIGASFHPSWAAVNSCSRTSFENPTPVTIKEDDTVEKSSHALSTFQLVHFAGRIQPLQDSMLHSNPQHSIRVYIDDDTNKTFFVKL